MSDKKIHRAGWRLMPSFKPVECVAIEDINLGFGSDVWLRLENGKYINSADFYGSLEGAISAGYARVEAMDADIAKRSAVIRKKRAALDKAAQP